MQSRTGRLGSIPLLALAVMLLAACGDGDDGPTEPETPTSALITTTDAQPPQFSPTSVTVSAGGQLAWRNESSVAHNVVAATSNWQLNRDLPVGGGFNTTIAEPGTYGFECTIHTGMTGTVVVE